MIDKAPNNPLAAEWTTSLAIFRDGGVKLTQTSRVELDEHGIGVEATRLCDIQRSPTDREKVLGYMADVIANVAVEAPVAQGQYMRQYCRTDPADYSLQ